jgi:hypothetical protein
MEGADRQEGGGGKGEKEKEGRGHTDPTHNDLAETEVGDRGGGEGSERKGGER